MDNTLITSSNIQWPPDLASKPGARYDSLSLLYNKTDTNVFGQHMGFILSCSNSVKLPNCVDATLQKLDVITKPNFNDAKMKITHEVQPDLGFCNQIIPVNDSLQAACFNGGCIIGIKNFGYNKTFNSDVRNKLSHHSCEVNCLAANLEGSLISSGGAKGGEITLYQVRQENIEFLARTKLCDALIAGLCFLKSSDQICAKPDDATSGDNVLVWATGSGQIGFLDTRVADGKALEYYGATTSKEPLILYTTLCSVPELPGHQVFFGGNQGEFVAIDFRNNQRYLHYQKKEGDGVIRRIKKIVVEDSGKRKIFLGFTNQTQDIQIYDAKTREPAIGWVCDRNPRHKQRDLIQVGNRIVSCGDKTSIGCWNWNPQPEEEK